MDRVAENCITLQYLLELAKTLNALSTNVNVIKNFFKKFFFLTSFVKIFILIYLNNLIYVRTFT